MSILDYIIMNEMLFLDDTRNDLPREKLEKKGPSALSDKELIMLLIGSGNAMHKAEDIADEVLRKIDKNPEISFHDLLRIPGMGIAKSSAICASLELGRRKISKKQRMVTRPDDIFREVMHYASREQEHFITIMLNGAHEVIGTFISTIGLLNRTLVHPREVFSPAIEKRAAAIALAHNHPSGNLEPSAEDKEVTERLKKAGVILGIPVLDHLVFSNKGYYSFLEHSLM